ncbi:venom acid phosphatase Acph-1 [Nasonia vitripennis]|uniref:acid phosphatase n=1 Tax=Nasonia vitripennis TaxID=7425 RepID=A0A7M7G8A3_NASVI|nr:venom acid phosphatase Acph-1 [Nasonia vitripennis]
MKRHTSTLTFSLIVSLMTCASTEEPKLKTLSVIFRHGDRAPIFFTPTDPNREKDIYPLELGTLNNQGKLREYNLGHLLRQRYNDFLGPYYETTDVFAMSTDVGRTKMSLLLVLAGLYPPVDKQIWNKELNWQPVSSYAYVPDKMDPILGYLIHCPAYIEEYIRVQNSPEFQAKLSKYDGLMKNLSILTGASMKNSLDVYALYIDLGAELSSNLQLPAWAKDYWPEGPMLEESLLEYELQNYNRKLKKYNGGATISKILATVNSENPKKLNLYSAHENNVAGLLYALGVWDHTIPNFSSAILFEHHENSSQKFIKMIYYKGIPAVFDELTIPGCDTLCPLEDFHKIVADLISENPIEACYGPPGNSTLVPKGVQPVQWIYDQMMFFYGF